MNPVSADMSAKRTPTGQLAPYDLRMVVRVFLAILLAAGFAYGWRALDRIPILVVGQPTATGFIQADIEEPFFENLANETDLPIDVTYESSENVGIKDTFQLAMLRTGALDLVSLRLLQNSTIEPTMLGLDLIGLTTDLATARDVAEAYSPVVDKRLEERFNTKLLGVWPFGPQVFFCNKPMTRLGDIAGLRVRVANEVFAPVLKSSGAKTVVIGFEDVRNALRDGLIDCAITSAASGYAAGWGEYSTHLYTLNMHFGVNAYVISDKVWNRLSSAEQDRLQDAFTAHVDRIWHQVEHLHEQATACLGGGPCELGPSAQLVVTEPVAEDVTALASAFESTTFREWAAQCDEVNPGCAQRWRTAVDPVLAKHGA